jgi:hypothetical protein
LVAAPAGDWPSDVPNWKQLEPGEHPRLVFRKADLPALRAKAKTPEGQAIVANIQKQLDRTPYSTWHAAGYAFLWQLTQDAKHADKAKEMAQKTLAKTPNTDSGKYTWPGNGQLRGGPCLWGLALAYDLAYDGWTPEFRKEVAAGIMANPHFAAIANKPAHSPGVNHWGAHTGGLGCALLALRGDPEADQKIIEDYLDKVVTNAKREITEGYGSRGYYYEGHHCGRISSNTGILPFIQAYRLAAGKDLVAHNVNAQWLSAKWIYDLVAQPGGAIGSLQRGMYCRPFALGKGFSENGDFAIGFGVVPDQYKPALLWTANHVVQPGSNNGYDVLATPLHGVYALANWPLGTKEQNPAEVLPNVLHDTGPNYFVFRNGWKGDGTDLMVTAMMGSRPDAGRKMASGGSVLVAGRGLNAGGAAPAAAAAKGDADDDAVAKQGGDPFFRFPGMFYTSKLTYSRLAKDGSGVISARHIKAPPAPTPLPDAPTSLAVDYSKAAGVDLLIAMTGPQAGYQVEYWMGVKPLEKPVEATGVDGWKTRTVKIEPSPDGVSQPWYIMTLQKGEAPAVKVEKNTITVGKQTLTFDGEKIVVGTMGPELKLATP